MIPEVKADMPDLEIGEVLPLQIQEKAKKNDYISRMLMTIDPRKLSARGISCYTERFARQYDQMTPEQRERAETEIIFRF